MKNYEKLLLAGIASILLVGNSFAMETEITNETVMQIITKSDNFYAINPEEIGQKITFNFLRENKNDSIIFLNLSNNNLESKDLLLLKSIFPALKMVNFIGCKNVSPATIKHLEDTNKIHVITHNHTGYDPSNPDHQGYC